MNKQEFAREVIRRYNKEHHMGWWNLGLGLAFAACVAFSVYWCVCMEH